MPTISWFYGIAIRMFIKDHPPPHFHATYGEYEAIVAIEDGEIIGGRLPRAAARLVRDWALLNKADLMQNWERARQNVQPERIAGLDAD